MGPWTGEIEQVGLYLQDGQLGVPLILDRRASIVYAVNLDQKPLIEEKTSVSLITEKVEMDTNWMILSSF